MRCFRPLLPLALVLLSGLLAAAAGATGAPGTYILVDHPGGHLQDDPCCPGPYGLRLDSLPPFGPGPSFSVESGPGDVVLSWDGGDSALIQGVLQSNFDGSLWSVLFTVTGIVAEAGGFRAPTSEGTLTWQSGPSAPAETVISLTGKQDKNGDAFAFLADGRRLPGDDSSVVARGWAEGVGANDWLAVALPTTVVPEPGTASLLLMGLLLVATRSRR